MWLLNTLSLQLKAFESTSAAAAQSYAILSHRWGSEEITFQDISSPTETVKQKLGYQKVMNFCAWARDQKISYVWIDTCCIDKTSSAELSEAINSMFMWYREAKICVVYFSDVPIAKQDDLASANTQKSFLMASQWFERGFTLQELIAPKRRMYLAHDWSQIRDSLWPETITQVLSLVSGITTKVLRDRNEIWSTCIAERMSWAAHRKTTRPEDRAYSLMGLFGVNMPVLYGEGMHNAFRRLQQEIMQRSSDQTLFAWRDRHVSHGLLADSPFSFRDTPKLGLWRSDMLAPTTVTNLGILIRPCIYRPFSKEIIRVALQCDVMTDQGWMCLLLYLELVPNAACFIAGKRHEAYRRVQCDTWYAVSSDDLENDNVYDDILVLEDHHHDLVINAQRQHDARWATDRYGSTPLTMKI